MRRSWIGYSIINFINYNIFFNITFYRENFFIFYYNIYCFFLSKIINSNRVFLSFVLSIGLLNWWKWGRLSALFSDIWNIYKNNIIAYNKFYLLKKIRILLLNYYILMFCKIKIFWFACYTTIIFIWISIFLIE